MRLKSLIILLFGIFIISMLNSCKKDDKKIENPGITADGVFILNEGAFGSSNGSISYYNTLTGGISQHVFENVNGYPLGDLVQSMTMYQNKGYIIVNNSQKIEIVNASTFSSIATITGFSGPRFMVAKGNKGFVSDWFDNEIKILNLNTNTITSSVATGSGPEQMVISGNSLFVANVGGWDSDSTISIINTDTETLVATVQVGINPNSLKIDANGKIWVLCGGSTGPDYLGGTADDIAGSLWRIDPATYNIEQQFVMNSADHPSKLQIKSNGTELFYLNGLDGYNGKIMHMNISATNLPATSSTTKEFYGLGIDPVSGIIYGGYAQGFSQNGYAFRYTPTFGLIDSVQVGIGPNYFVFQ